MYGLSMVYFSIDDFCYSTPILVEPGGIAAHDRVRTLILISYEKKKPSRVFFV